MSQEPIPSHPVDECPENPRIAKVEYEHDQIEEYCWNGDTQAPKLYVQRTVYTCNVCGHQWRGEWEKI